MELHPEYIEFLNDEIKAFNKELISILGLPDVQSFRNRIKKDKRNTQAMLKLYQDITCTNDRIREVKNDIRVCIVDMCKKLGKRTCEKN